MTHAADLRWQAQQRGGTWKNTDATECPAYGVFEVTGYTVGPYGRPIVQGKRPTEDGKAYGVNGPYKVAASSHGRCTFDFPAFVAGGAGINAGIGPVDGQWSMTTDGEGYVSLGANDGFMLVIPLQVAKEAKQVIEKARANTTISPNSTGSFEILRNGNDVLARYDHAHGNEIISQGKDVFIGWLEDEQRWQVIGADCET